MSTYMKIRLISYHLALAFRLEVSLAENKHSAFQSYVRMSIIGQSINDNDSEQRCRRAPEPALQHIF